MRKLFGGKTKNRANGSSRDLSAEEQAGPAPVPTPIHSKLATSASTSPPPTATLTKLSPAQKARQQQIELEQQEVQLAIQQQQEQAQQPRRASPPQPGTTPPNDDDPERWEVVSTGHIPTPLESPTHRSQAQMQHIIPPSRSSSYSSIPPPPSLPAAQGQRPASPAASFTMKQQSAPRPGGAGSQVYNQLAALGPAQPKKPTAPVAVALLKSLEPPRPTVEQMGSRYSDYGDRHSLSDHSLQQQAPAPPEKEPKRRFWHPKDKAKDVVQQRENLPRQDSNQGHQTSNHGHGGSGGHAQPGQGYDEPTKDLTRRIGYLAATASEDFALVYDVCDRASANEANAKEAVKALRSEFKYGEPRAQLSAARLWAVMLHNSSPIFVVQSRSRKFMDTIEDLLTSPRTNPVVKERLLDVVGAAAYATRHHSKQDGFQALWRKVKPHDKPDEGVPFDTEDPMFNPAPSSRNSQFEVPYSASAQPSPGLQQQQTPVSAPPLQPGARDRGDREGREGRDDRERRGERERTGGPRQRKSPTRNRIIPLEEDIRRLLQECKIGLGNAELLSNALNECVPEDIRGNEIIEEFTMKCRSSQELIFAQIPWATAQAERSRVARDAEHEAKTKLDVSYRRARDDADETLEEKLLARLLLSNEALVDALKQYDDLIRIADERRAEERSRKEVRMDRRERELAAAQEAYASNGARSDAYSNGGKLGTSRPSIDRSRSPASSVRSHESREKSSTFSHHALPQGPRDPHYHQSPQMQHREGYQPHQEYEVANLAPPPSGPHGPRSPGQFSVRTRTPSPSGGSLVDQQQQAAYQMQHGQLRLDQQQYGGVATPNTATPNTATPNGLHGYGYHHPHSQRDDRYQQNAQAYGHDDAGSTYGGVGSANGHAVRYGGYDDEDLEYEDGTPIRPSAKALGKRKVVDPEPSDSPHHSDPDELGSANHINPSLDAIDNLSDMDAESLLELTNRADNENEGNGGLLEDDTVGGKGSGKHGMWPGQKPVQFVYDAAAERTKQRLEEAQRMLEQGPNLNGVVPVVH